MQQPEPTVRLLRETHFRLQEMEARLFLTNPFCPILDYFRVDGK